MAVVVVLVSAAVGATMPAVALSLAVDVGESAPTLQVLLFLGAAVLVALFAVSLAGVLTSTIRSPLLSSGAFLGAVSFGQLLDQPTLPDNIRNLLPMRAISMILESSAPTGAMLPGGGNFAVGASPLAVDAALVLAGWCLALIAGAVVVFGSRDVRE